MGSQSPAPTGLGTPYGGGRGGGLTGSLASLRDPRDEPDPWDLDAAPGLPDGSFARHRDLDKEEAEFREAVRGLAHVGSIKPHRPWAPGEKGAAGKALDAAGSWVVSTLPALGRTLGPPRPSSRRRGPEGAPAST